MEFSACLDPNQQSRASRLRSLSHSRIQYSWPQSWLRFRQCKLWVDVAWILEARSQLESLWWVSSSWSINSSFPQAIKHSAREQCRSYQWKVSPKGGKHTHVVGNRFGILKGGGWRVSNLCFLFPECKIILGTTGNRTRDLLHPKQESYL